jgi:DNA-binding winged helix-turn-helix (wHTH) protein/TolB-like protein
MTYLFGPFRYDATQRVLFRGEELVPLVPKAVDTLHVLLERHGQVVEKAELMKLVWPDTVVEDVGLARNISLLRKALAENGAENDEFIETVPRRGYRFSAPVSVPTVTPLPQPGPIRFPLRALIAVFGICALALLVYFQFYVPSRFVPRASGAASLAVVPFTCHCPAGEEAWAEGFDDLIVAELANFDRIQVVAPSTVRRHQKAGVSTGLMGRLLGLDALVEGTVQKIEGGQVRFTARLVDVHTGKVIWASTYDQPGSDRGAAQRHVSRAIATSARNRLK